MKRDKILTVRVSQDLKDAIKSTAYDMKMTRSEFVNYVLTTATDLKIKTKQKFYLVNRHRT